MKSKMRVTGKTHIFYKEPKVKKECDVYCLNDKEHKGYMDRLFPPNQTPNILIKLILMTITWRNIVDLELKDIGQ